MCISISASNSVLWESAATSAPVCVLRGNHLGWAEITAKNTSSLCDHQLDGQVSHSLCPQHKNGSALETECVSSMISIIFDIFWYFWHVLSTNQRPEAEKQQQEGFVLGSAYLSGIKAQCRAWRCPDLVIAVSNYTGHRPGACSPVKLLPLRVCLEKD